MSGNAVKTYSAEETKALLTRAAAKVMGADESAASTTMMIAFGLVKNGTGYSKYTHHNVDTAIKRLQDSTAIKIEARGKNNLLISILKEAASSMRSGVSVENGNVVEASQGEGTGTTHTVQLLAARNTEIAEGPPAKFIDAWNATDTLLERLEPEGKSLTARLGETSPETAWDKKDNIVRLSSAMLQIHGALSEKLEAQPEHKADLDQLYDEMDTLRRGLQNRRVQSAQR